MPDAGFERAVQCCSCPALRQEVRFVIPHQHRPGANALVTSLRRLGVALFVAAISATLLIESAQAHVLKDFGPYSVALGWVAEPTYVGEQNAVQVVIKDAKGNAVVDVDSGDLKVVVSVGGQESASLDLLNKYDPDTGLGVPGDYEAPLIPTVPGDYTFHLTGKIHDTAIDETATSSDSTFESAVDSTDIQFPTKVPSLTEVTTRLDRLDARVAAAASSPPAASVASAPPETSAIDAAAAANSAAAQARDSATTALVVAVVLGGLGVILGAAGLFVATQRRPVDRA
jgi:hypothetical protein